MAKRGRPTDYKEEYNEQVFKLCLLGATDAEIADFFDVVESTINLWKKEYPEFSESIKRGKLIADANTANSLYKRANGYKFTEKTFETNSEGEMKLTKEVEKEIPPDTGAAMAWLKNRRKEQWRDRHDIEFKDTTDEMERMNRAQERLENAKRNDQKGNSK